MRPSQLVIFDRDGVLNETVSTDRGERPPWSLAELTVVPGAARALTDITAMGYRAVAATNQPDVPRGSITIETVEAINRAIRAALPQLERVYVCSHDNADECDCRKPKPGMILAALADANADADSSWMVGDRWTDVLAGQRAGVRTVLIRNKNAFAETSAGGPPTGLAPDYEIETISELALLLSRFQQ